MHNSTNNDNRKRQNIVSTYELCHECFDPHSLVSSPSNLNGKSHITPVSHNLRSTPANSSNANHVTFNNKLQTPKSMQNINSPNKTNLGTPSYHSCVQNGNNVVNSSCPNKIITSNSNHELTNSANSHFHQNNTGHESGSPFAHHHHLLNNNIEVDESKNKSQNVHVVSQKVISIGGLTNGNDRSEDSQSTLVESKSASSKSKIEI